MNNSMNTRTRYVHVNSNHRLPDDYVVSGTNGNMNPENKAIINVHLQTPIKNVWRVAVKSFTMANSAFNVKSGENTLKWVEYFKGGTMPEYVAKSFFIEIDPGYYTTSELCLFINTKIAALPPTLHRLSSENSLLIVFQQHSDKYNIQVKLTQDSGDKWFMPVSDDSSHAIWTQLGFADNQVLNLRNASSTLEQMATVYSAALNTASYGGLSVVSNIAQADTVLETINFVSTLPATIENSGGLYIVSDDLTTGSTYESRTNPNTKHCEAVPMNILEWVQFEVDRYHWVQYQSQTLHYHYLNDKSITDFNIILKSQFGQILTHNECGNYNLVLVFETIEHDEISANFIKAYNREGYTLAHKKDETK